MIKITQIDHGPNSGRWSWQIDCEPRPVNKGRISRKGEAYTRPSARQGICLTENLAQATADRAWRFHHAQQPS